MRCSPTRRLLLAGALATASRPAFALVDRLHIGGARGTIDFAIGSSAIFRTTGSFKDWQGTLTVDDGDVPHSTVDVVVQTKSVEMPDVDQTEMLRGAEFFDVAKFPAMIYRSRLVERTSDSKLEVEGEITLRGITRPMALAVSVTDLRPDAEPGARYARVRAKGKLKRSEFGMLKYIDVVGDMVEIAIRAEAWR